MLRKRLSIILAFIFVLSLVTCQVQHEKAEQNNFGNFGVIGLHALSLKDTAQTEAFEKFIKNEYLPVFKDRIPGEKILIAKADRGMPKAKYVILFVFDTLERRNFYIPQEGKLSKEGQTIVDSLRAEPVFNKFREYVEQDFLADYVVIQ